MATLPSWEEIGRGQPKLYIKGRQFNTFKTNAQVPGTKENQIVQVFGSPEAYREAVNEYDVAYGQYLVDFYGERGDNTAQVEKLNELKEKQKYTVTAAMQKQADRDPYYAAQLADPNLLKLVIDDPDEALKLRQESRANAISSVRTQLENQYNNLQKIDSRFGYAGRNADLNAVFNQQAAQLADAGVTNIGDLRIQDGRLVDSATGKVVSTSNLGGQVAVDRDTGVQKWGDIFSGVEGGANYGIMQSPDGSVLLFPAWEKTKSLAAQIGGRELEKYITPLLTIGGAVVGVPGLGAVGGAAGGAAIGSTAGQLLASGEVDWEKVALSAGGAGAGAYVKGLITGAEAAGASGAATPTADLTGTTYGGMTGADAGFSVAAGTPAYDLLGPVDFTRIGETGLIPSEAYSEITAVERIAADGSTLPSTITGLSAPGLSSMGGAMGVTIPVVNPVNYQPGLISEMGFVPSTATPSLGDPASFINNPDYLGAPVISEDYLATTAADMPSAMNIKDVLNMARTGMQLFGGQQQGLLGGGMGGGGGQTAAGVDYSGLLSLLQGKARTPGVSPLIAPVVSPVASPYEPLLGQQPQYQSLIGRTQQSLLG